MKHFAQYHNAASAGELPTDTDGFSVVTTKSLADLGDMIWLWVGLGDKSPKEFYLAYRFIVETTVATSGSRFSYRKWGSEGIAFHPQIRLDGYSWWKGFFESQGRGAFGLHQIRAEHVTEFEALAHSATAKPFPANDGLLSATRILGSVTREHVLCGIELFDKQMRALPRWQNWQGSLSQKYALVFEEQWYPPKMMLSLGAGISRERSFGGVEKSQANGRLEQLGFKVIPILHHEREYLRPDESEQDGQQQSALDSYVEDGRDTRELVERAIRTRRGQQGFRSALRDRYGDACLISGCELLDVLEAAHIAPYRGKNDHNVENGLLIRADLHTLFDLDLIGIEPETLTVHVHPRATAGGYGQFDGQRLRCSETARPSKNALRRRWKVFRKQD